MGGSSYRAGKFGGKGRTTHYVVVATASDGTIAILDLDTKSKNDAYKEAKAIYNETRLKDVVPAVEFQATTQLNAQSAQIASQEEKKKIKEKVRNKNK